MNPLPDRSNYSPLCHTHYLTPDQYFTSLFGPDPLQSRELEQKLLNNMGYSESPEFSQALGLIGEGSEPLSRVFNDQPRGIYGGIRTYVRF